MCNRDPVKAATLAQKFNGSPAAFENLADHLAAADIVVTGTGSAQPIITKSLFETVLKRRKYRPVFLIDIAVPRDVEAAVGDLRNVYLYNLDDLQQVVAATAASAARDRRGGEDRRRPCRSIFQVASGPRTRGL